MLVAVFEGNRGRETERGRDEDFSEVMTGWHGVWSQSKPRVEPAEGPPSAKVRGSGWTPRHSQGSSPGGKGVKLLIVTTNLLNMLQLTSPPTYDCLVLAINCS